MSAEMQLNDVFETKMDLFRYGVPF